MKDILNRVQSQVADGETGQPSTPNMDIRNTSGLLSAKDSYKPMATKTTSP